MSDWFTIIPNFPYPDTLHPHQDSFIFSIEHLLQEIVEPPLPEEPLDTFYLNLKKKLPLIHYTFPSPADTLILSALCLGEFGHGMGRFISDTCSRWILPGKQIPIVMARSLNFVFAGHSTTQFFINQLVLHINPEEDLVNIKNHIQHLIENMRLSILAVEQTRKIVSMKSLTLKQKKIVLEENLTSLIKRPEKNASTIFDYAHHLVVKATSEEKMEELHKTLSPLLTINPETFDRDLFEEIHPFLSLFNDSFKAIRESKHLIRLIAYEHLFKKILKHSLTHHPSHGQVSLKLLRSSLCYERLKQPVLGILVGINLMSDHELLEEKHLFRAVQTIIPQAIKVPHSYLTDRRSDPRMRIAYLEIKKTGRTPLSQAEIADLRKKLPSEIKKRIETVVHPLHIEPSEEETMRHILLLSKEIQSIKDLPQTSIHFHDQTTQHIIFSVILLRLVKNGEKSLKSLIDLSPFSTDITEISTKIVGVIKKRYLKEANLFEIRLNKKPFLREDSSLDLRMGRQCVISILTHLFGGVNDFNGGMVSKQQELLSELKGLLKGKSRQSAFLVENFFYSITPIYMQSLLPPSLLKTFFFLLIEALEHNFTAEPFFSKTEILHNTFMMMLASPHSLLIETIHSKLQENKTLFSELTCSKVSSYELHTLGYLLNFEEQSEYIELRNIILSAIVTWQGTECPIIKPTLLPILS
ncbi:MAG: hypothetical protein KBC64_00085 [Simkaniaceae bacterium]|nr:hypothetical protein [Simkaniaceae bacterium]